MPRFQNIDRSILEVALAALENQKAELEAMIESARRQLGARPVQKDEGAPAAQPAARRKKGRKRTMSAEARARIAEAQRKRWAASKKGSAPAEKTSAAPAAKAAAPAPASKRGGKRVMSPEARKRIAEAQRKRWAATKKAAK
jgi:hypothetical protein